MKPRIYFPTSNKLKWFYIGVKVEVTSAVDMQLRKQTEAFSVHIGLLIVAIHLTIPFGKVIDL